MPIDEEDEDKVDPSWADKPLTSRAAGKIGRGVKRGTRDEEDLRALIERKQFAKAAEAEFGDAGFGWSLDRAVAAPLSGQAVALLERAMGQGEQADSTMRRAQARGSAAAGRASEVAQDAGVPAVVIDPVISALQSAPLSVPAVLGGPLGLAATAGAITTTSTQSAYVDRKDSGQRGNVLAGNAALSGASDATAMMIFNALKIPGIEGLLGRTTKEAAAKSIGQGIKDVSKRVLGAYGQELPEELTAEALQTMFAEMDGTSKEELTPRVLYEKARDVAASTFAMTAGFSAVTEGAKLYQDAKAKKDQEKALKEMAATSIDPNGPLPDPADPPVDTVPPPVDPNVPTGPPPAPAGAEAVPPPVPGQPPVTPAPPATGKRFPMDMQTQTIDGILGDGKPRTLEEIGIEIARLGMNPESFVDGIAGVAKQAVIGGRYESTKDGRVYLATAEDAEVDTESPEEDGVDIPGKINWRSGRVGGGIESPDGKYAVVSVGNEWHLIDPSAPITRNQLGKFASADEAKQRAEELRADPEKAKQAAAQSTNDLMGLTGYDDPPAPSTDSTAPVSDSVPAETAEPEPQGSNELEVWVDGKRQLATVTGSRSDDGTWRIKRVKLSDPETGMYRPYELPAEQASGYESYEQARDEVFGLLKDRFKKPDQIEAATPVTPALPEPTPEAKPAPVRLGPATPPKQEPEDTRGKGVQYHGARTAITDLDEGYSNEDNIYGGFDTFYTTDAQDIAKGYGRKNPNAKVYRIVENKPVKFFDMEQTMPEEKVAALFGGDSAGIVEDAIASTKEAGREVSLRNVMDEIRGLSQGFGITKSGVQEYFDNATYSLTQEGFGGMTHIGGLITGKKPHAVKIYFNPAESITLIDEDGNEVKSRNPPKPAESAKRPDPFDDTPEGRQYAQAYMEAKAANPGKRIAYRVGDSYELFRDDANDAAKRLGLSRTFKGDINTDNIALVAKFPADKLQAYLDKMGGDMIAIEPPKAEPAAPSRTAWADSKADAFEAQAQQLEGGRGTAVGAAEINDRIKADALRSFSRKVQGGMDPAEAATMVKAEARGWVAKHNARRPKDVNWKRYEGIADYVIDQAEKQTPAIPKPAPTPVSLGKPKTAPAPETAPTEGLVAKAARAMWDAPDFAKPLDPATLLKKSGRHLSLIDRASGEQAIASFVTDPEGVVLATQGRDYTPGEIAINERLIENLFSNGVGSVYIGVPQASTTQLIEALSARGYLIEKNDGKGHKYRIDPKQAAGQTKSIPAPAKPQPWAKSKTEDESRWFGTEVSVEPGSRNEDQYEGKVVRVLNGGEVVEVQPQGQDGTFRVPSSRVEVKKVVDSKAEPELTEMTAEDEEHLFGKKKEPKQPKTFEDLSSLTFDDVSDESETEGAVKNKGVFYRRETFEVTDKDGKQRKYNVAINSRDNVPKVERGDLTKEQTQADQIASYDSLKPATKQKIVDIGMDDMLSYYQKYDVGLFIEGRTDGERGTERAVKIVLGGQVRPKVIAKAMGREGDSTATWDDVFEFLRKPSDSPSQYAPDDTAEIDAMMAAALAEADAEKQAAKAPRKPSLGPKTPKANAEADTLEQVAARLRKSKAIVVVPMFGVKNALAQVTGATGTTLTIAPLGQLDGLEEQEVSAHLVKQFPPGAISKQDREALLNGQEVDEARIVALLNAPPATDAPKQPTKIQKKAAAAKAKSAAILQEMFDEMDGMTNVVLVLNPKLASIAIRYALAKTEEGALTFAAFAEQVFLTVPPERYAVLKPYFESGWRVLHQQGRVDDPAGNLDDYKQANQTQTTSQDDGRDVLTEGDSADQGGSSQGGRNPAESGGSKSPVTLGGKQPRNAPATEKAGDLGGLRDDDPGSLQQESPGTGEQLGDDSVGSGTGTRGDADAGTRGTGSGRRGRKGSGDPVATDGEPSGMNLAPQSSRPNFHLTDPDKIIGGGLKDKFKRNQRALELAEELEQSGRPPTQEDLETLASYIGWGAFGQELFQGTWDNARIRPDWQAENEWLREYLGEDEWRSAKDSIVNAHYTDPEVVTGMWEMMRRMGFKGGRVLEPSFGVGNFAALMPRDLMAHSSMTAIELDRATARIAKILYPGINVQQKGYQQSQTPDDFYDAAITNVPFGNYTISDKRYRQKYSIHNYFFRRAIDQVKPGGLIAFITSNATMDGKEQAMLLRKQLSERADLVAAYRFPTGAFERYAKTKVVADLIILRKRKPGEDPSPLNKDWIDIETINTPSGQTIDVNQYWAKHPDHVMGTLNHGNGTTSGRPGMIVDKPADLASKWLSLTESVPADIMNTDRAASEGKERPNEKKLRQNTVLMHKPSSGAADVYVAKGEQLLPLKDYVNWYRAGSKPATIDKMRQELSQLIGVRNALEVVLSKQGQGEDAAVERAELNKLYDAFVAKYGYISESKSIGYLMAAGDAIANAVKSLESKLPDGTYDKRAIFTKTTVRQAPRVGDKLDPVDAFAIARNNSIDIDWDSVAEMAKKPKAEVLAELESKDMIYKVGEDLYDATDVFLSGNMARKIRSLEAAKAEGVKGLDKAIAAAKKVMPEPLQYNQIQVSLGAPWITGEDYSQFVADLLATEPDRTKLTRGSRGWRTEFGADVNGLPGVAMHGHPDVPFSRMIAAALNNARVKVFYRNDKGDQQFDETATAEANAKLDELKDKFKDWIWQSPDRIARLSQAYNEDFRSTVTPDFQKMNVPLRFEGLALQRGEDPFSLRKHQEAAVWRGIIAGKGLFAHEVGTGKTLTIGALAIESRRLRLANKPMLLAHNANSGAVYREIQAAYPGAKVLYVDNLAPGLKQETMASIATEDWDLIVVPHSMGEKFKMRPETLELLLREQMDELEAAALEAYAEDESSFKGAMPADLNNVTKDDMKRLRSRTAKELVKERMKLRERIMEAYNVADAESTIFVEDMGIDMVMVDEAHIFKKLPIATRQQVKGLNKAASQPGSMLMLLADYVRGNQNGRGVYLFTGTPVTNTLNEIYNMQRFIMPDEMQAVGVKDWDGWFNTFATSESADELSSGGTYETFERLTSFVNLPELREMIGQYMDTVFADEMPEFKPRETRTGRIEEGTSPNGRPYKEVRNETLPMSPAQKAISVDLARRYREMRAAKGKAKQEMMRQREWMPLVIESEGVKMALDPRLVDDIDTSSIDPKDPTLKINRMITGAMEHYYEHPKSSQMIFMQIGHSDWTERVTGRDLDGKPIKQRVRVFNLAKEIKRRLIEEGVSADEIVLFSELSKDKRREAADAMNRGEIRFAIGGTETMGTGVNAQENLRAMHHLDAPWMPGDLEQRNGRGQRQGNRWNTVLEYRYLTEGPQDGRRWQVLLTKERFIKRFIRSKGEERVIDMSDVDLDDQGGGDMEQTFAAAVGDPRIQQKFKLEREVTKLETGRERHINTLWDTSQRAKQVSRALEAKRRDVELLQQDSETYQSTRPESSDAKPQMILQDQSVVGMDTINTSLKALQERYFNTITAKPIKLGTYRGLPLQVNNGILYVGKSGLSVSYSLGSIDGTLRNLGRRIETQVAAIQKDEAFIKAANDSAGMPFPRQGQLDAKRKRLAALRAEMEANPEGSPSWFRNAAPIGSAIFIHKRKREGRQAFEDMETELFREAITREPAPYTSSELEEQAVTGYRSDTHVFYERGDQTIAVRADQVFDENGTPIFRNPADAPIDATRPVEAEAVTPLPAPKKPSLGPAAKTPPTPPKPPEPPAPKPPAESGMAKQIRQGDVIPPKSDAAAPPPRGVDAFIAPDDKKTGSMGSAKRQVLSASDLIDDYALESSAAGTHVGPDKELEKDWAASRFGLSRKKMWQRIKDAWNAAPEALSKSFLRGALPELPRTKQFGEARSLLRIWKDATEIAKWKTGELLRRTTDALSTEDYDLFARAIVFRNFRNRQGALPWDLTRERADAELARIEAKLPNHPNVQAALDFRAQWQEEMKEAYLYWHRQIGIDMGDRLGKEDYFHHQVLWHYRMKEAVGSGGGSKDAQANLRRGWLNRETGSPLPINANYVQAEWEVSTQMIADTIRAEALAKLTTEYDTLPELERKAKIKNMHLLYGGKKQYEHILYLREMRAQADPEDRKIWSQQLRDLDPLYGFRQDIAIKSNAMLNEEPWLAALPSASFFKELRRISNDPKDPSADMAEGLLGAIKRQEIFIEETIGEKNYQTWRTMMPATHQAAAIRPGRALYQAFTIPEKLANELMANHAAIVGIQADVLRSVLVMGHEYTPIVVPHEVAAQMEAMATTPGNTYGAGFSRWVKDNITFNIKRMLLLSPERVIKYNLRSLSEIDKLLTMMPKAAKPAMLWESAKELLDVFQKKDQITPEVRLWMELGGAQSLHLPNEITDLEGLKEFSRFFEKNEGYEAIPAKAWAWYWDNAGKWSNYRESIMRYSAFKAYRKELQESGGKVANYGGTNADEVRGIRDIDRKAMRLSADLLGDYGDISPVGQFLRDAALGIPFYSFAEVNFRTYINGIKNLANHEQSATAAGRSLAKALGVTTIAKSPYLAYRLGRIGLLVFGAQAALTTWNMLLFGDDEEDLPDEIKNRPHLNLGRNADNSKNYFDRLGTSTDFLDWLGLNSIEPLAQQVIDGKITMRDVAKELVMSPTNKAVQSLSPTAKVPIGWMTGKDLFPDVRNRRSITDQWEFTAQAVGLGSTYRAVSGLPSKGAGAWVQNLFMSTISSGSAAYFRTRDEIQRASNRGSLSRDSLTPRAEALYYYKQALRFGDESAAKRYEAAYRAEGGTDKTIMQSLKMLHPLGTLSLPNEIRFRATLDARGEKELAQAEEYFYRDLVTPEQAEEIKGHRADRVKDLAKTVMTHAGRPNPDTNSDYKTASAKYEADYADLKKWLDENRDKPDVRLAVRGVLRSDRFQTIEEGRTTPQGVNESGRHYQERIRRAAQDSASAKRWRKWFLESQPKALN